MLILQVIESHEPLPSNCIWRFNLHASRELRLIRLNLWCPLATQFFRFGPIISIAPSLSMSAHRIVSDDIPN
jgi:hypothetical protein